MFMNPRIRTSRRAFLYLLAVALAGAGEAGAASNPLEPPATSSPPRDDRESDQSRGGGVPGRAEHGLGLRAAGAV